MTNLTDKWKKGELLEGYYYVRCAWSDEIEIRYVHNGVDDWQEIIAEVPSYKEWQELKEYERIVASYYMKPIDYETACETVNKLLDKRKALKEENTKLKEQLAHVTRTQAKQFRDNQKLQVKAEHAKDVVNIDTARQIKQLKELLKECGEE